MNNLLSSQKKLNLIPIRQLKCEQARRSFWHYCQLREPDFYKESRTHLFGLCTVLNNFYYGLPLDDSGKIYTKLMIAMPPQHGKTRTLINFNQWVLGKNNNERIITGAYNEMVASDLGEYTRDGIREVANTDDQIVFSDIFPDTKMKYGAESKQKWALYGQHFNFLSTSPGGTATGKGATLKIYDDLIKNESEAFNETHLNKLYSWMIGTMGSRNDSDAKEVKEIICFTRWSKNDPAGRRAADEPGEWFELKMPAINDKGEMLCNDFLTKDQFEKLKAVSFKNDSTRVIFIANYYQECVDLEGRLYKKFKTYNQIPADEGGNHLFESIDAYCDTADQGDDYLVNLIYGVYQRSAYMLDVYMTKAGMEVTEPETARRLKAFNVNVARVESNSGGRGFARNVKRILNEDLKTKSVSVIWFHQSKNKKSRIVSQSANVQENVYYPADWVTRWPEFADHLKSYQKDGKAEHDDPEDAITGIVENLESNVRVLT